MKKIFNSLSILLILLATVFLPSFFVKASGEDATLSITPEIPGALEDVRITASSYSFDIDSAKIIWTLNGKIAIQGTGEKVFNFKNGPAGKKTVVSFLATNNNGVRVQKDFSFIPQDVDIVWEAETYTPPFYRGKAMPSSEAIINISAIPHFFTGGKRVSSANLVYDW